MQPIETAIDQPGHGSFRSIYHLAESVDLRAVNRTVFENLIQCGAMGGFGKRRAQLWEAIDRAG